MQISPIGAVATAPRRGPAAAPVPVNESLDFLSQLESYAREPRSQAVVSAAVVGTAPPQGCWPSQEAISAVLTRASTNVPEHLRSESQALHFDEETRRDITTIQTREAKQSGTATLERLVHRRQLHGGAVEVHWNPNFDSFLKLFGGGAREGLMRISDASSEANPDGKSMYGMALELVGRDGLATDILLTGGTEKAEASQAEGAEAQRALFNMIDNPNKIKGLARVAVDAGPISGLRMLHDLKKMKTQLDSVTELTAWSRSPFALQGKDGKEYLVKMRAVPSEAGPPLAVQGSTSSERLANEMKERLGQGEARWRLEFQFMQPGDDAYDAREHWNGPWLAAAEIVAPRRTDEAQAEKDWQRAEDTKFSVWKNKQPHQSAEDKDVLRPWGEMNRARLAAYQASGGNRKCPLGFS